MKARLSAWEKAVFIAAVMLGLIVIYYSMKGFLGQGSVPEPMRPVASDPRRAPVLQPLPQPATQSAVMGIPLIKLRFGIDSGYPRTLEEVGRLFRVTRERVRQIEAKAIRKLRHPSRSKSLRDYLE